MATYLDQTRTERNRNSLLRWLKQQKIQLSDIPFLGICLASLIYFSLHDPLLITTLGCSSIVFLSLWHTAKAIPIVERYIGCKIRFWHITTAIITSTALCSVLDSPANAIFLSGLE
ncbi:hypothetical protein [Microcoleus sp. OTE_8_concoct_300]|uniref:hypothetical protein n=1 Tax=Microcoleus sp. OTE_8_concoct_300 TaxID=2964710 RepID=UPI00403F3211